MKSIKELVLVDGSGFIFRAYYALPPMTRSDGTPVNAVFGFCNMLLKLLEKVQMEKGGEVAVAVIFDAARKTFRNEIYSEYKANRSDPPEDLIPQFKIIKDVPESFNLKSIQVLGFEADDLIASYAKIAQEKNIKITIVSSDKDLMQLLNENILMLDPMKNIEIRDKHVFEKFGVYPKQVIDVQSLAGDSSDNVPGVPGIGIKTAALLINEYGSLENLLENCEKIKQNKRRESISNNKDLAIISKKLVTLKDDVQLPIPIEDLSFQPLDKVKLINFLEDMEFSRIKSQVIAKFGDISSREIQNKKEEKKLGSGIIDAEESQVQMEKYELVCDESQLQTWINRAYEIGRVAIDTETDSLSATEAKIVGLSMSFENSEACYVPINHVNKDNNFSQIGIDSFVKIIKPLMEDNSILKIGQNIKYDYIILNNLGIKINNMDDTMLMSYVLFAGKHKHGLDDLSRIYLNHNVISFTSLTKIGRERKKFEEIDINDAKKYASEDSDVTHRLWSKFKKELIKQKLYSFYFYIERPLINVIAEMEIIGIKVDFNVLKTLAEKFETELNLIEKKIFSISNQTFNIASPKQLGDVLFNELKLPFGKKGKSGNYQTDVNILEKLKTEKIPIASYLLNWRQLQKLITTYCEGLISRKNNITARVHTSFGMASTLTGRLSSNDPNLQNLPIKTPEGKAIRGAFIANTGFKIVSIDYSQIELRILAEVANIEILRQGFEKGLDVHSITAKEVFQIEDHEISEDLRRKAKTINFGIIYGISAFGLATQLDISNSEAKEYIEKYFKQYPGIKEYMEKTIYSCRQDGFVETLFGRKIFIPYINDKSAIRRNFAERSAINAPIQGGAADMIKRSMHKVFNYLNYGKFKTKMLLQVHDELIFEVPEDEVDLVPQEIALLMEKAFDPSIEFKVPLKADIGIGKSWSESH